MSDFYFTEEGDIAVSPHGDITVAETWRDDMQQAYIRVMTEQGDFLLYPTLGASLSRLYGLPQTPETGAYGEQLIAEALNREGVFAGRSYRVKAIPTGHQTVRFDVEIVSGNRRALAVSVEQDLVLPPEPDPEPEPPASWDTVTGLLLDYDPSVLSQADGTSVTAFADSGPHALGLNTKSPGASYPTYVASGQNAKPGIIVSEERELQYYGPGPTQQMLEATVFVVADMAPTVVNVFLPYIGSDNDTLMHLAYSNPPDVTVTGNHFSNDAVAAFAHAGGVQLLVALRDSNGAQIWRNGASIGSGAWSPAAAPAFMGGGDFGNNWQIILGSSSGGSATDTALCTVYRVLVYDRALTATEISQISDYLTTTYGL